MAAQDLFKAGHSVTVFDSNIDHLRKLKRMADMHIEQFDVKNKAKLITLMKGFDIIVGALPAALGYYTMECAVIAHVDLVDMSYSARDPFLLHEKAKRIKMRIVPDAGFAPGLSNVLIGEIYQRYGGIDYLRILVGGIPQRPVLPFNYYITWSLSDLIEEYTRPSRIVRNHRLTTVPALSGIEEFSMAKIGRLECFYTDGLRTLLKTMKNVKNMEEKTIRYPGHANLFKTIIECGLLSDQKICCGNRSVKIKDVTSDYLREILRRGDHRDLSVLLIEIRKGKRKKRYTCIDHYDEKNGILSMARMTAYTGSLITQCIKKYPRFGVIPPEYLGMRDDLYKFILAELEKRNIDIKTN